MKSPADAAKVPLSFIAYQLISRDMEFERHSEMLAELEEFGFITPSALPPAIGDSPSMYQHGFRLDDINEIRSWVTQLDKARRVQDFPTDGLVFKVDELKIQQELGTGTTSPKWAVAFKYPPDQVKTRIKAIQWTVGKTGKITPVAEFEPVIVSGTKVARASLCNPNEIKQLGVNVGDEVIIEKSNEIIPKVISVAVRHSKHPAEPPKKCPVCGGEIQHYAEYKDVFCVNSSCKAQAEARLIYAVSKNALDVDGCGPQAISLLVAAGVNNLPALLKSDCACLKGATRKKVLESLKKAMGAPFWRKLSALSIDMWGKNTCQAVATRWPTMNALVDALDALKDKPKDKSDKFLDDIIGEKQVEELGVYLQAHNGELLALCEQGFFPDTAEEQDGTLAGKTFCITGEVGIQRHIAEEEIRKRGGLTKSSVSRKVDFLVVGNDPGANKQAAARRWGTKCLTPDELFEMMSWRPKLDAARANLKEELDV